MATVKSAENAIENLEAYLECESLESSTHPDIPTYRDLARASLRDFINQFNIIADEKALESALAQLLRPRIYEDAIPAVSALHVQGYTLLAIPPIDSATFRQHMLPNLPPELSVSAPSQTLSALYCQNESSFSMLLEHCQSLHPDIKPSQILVVSTGKCRVIEPASVAGFPTAFIHRENNLESKVHLDTATPTFVSNGLRGLCTQLGVDLGSSVPPVELPVGINHEVPFLPFRILYFYQATRILGHGSFGVSIYPKISSS